MKFKVKYEIDLSKEQQKQLVQFGKDRGHSFDDPDDKVILERVLKIYGTSAIQAAREEYDAAH